MPAPTANHEPGRAVYAGVHRALLYGMLASTALFALGVLRALPRAGHPRWIPMDSPLRPSWPQVWHGLAHLDPTSLMLVATLLLILTPVTRVAVACLAFAHDGDRKFVAVTAIVLAVIALTVVLGSLGLH